MLTSEIIDLAKFSLTVNDSQLNDDISDARWLQLAGLAYKNCWVRYRNQASKANILQSVDVEWTAGSATFTLPPALQNAEIYDLWYLDRASGNPYSRFNGQFETRNTLRLSYYGTVTATNFPFRIYYIPEVEVLQLTSTPNLIPPQHHEVIVWELLMTIKKLFDKEIPDSWENQRDSIEYYWVKEWSTRPMMQRANVVSLDSPILRPSA